MHILQTYRINFYLDARRPNKYHQYPVKIRIKSILEKKSKLYTTKFRLSQKDFDSLFSVNIKHELKKTKSQLNLLEAHFEEVASSLRIFSLNKFDQLVNKDKNITENVYYHFAIRIDDHFKSGRIKTADACQSAMNSIKDFRIYLKGKESTCPNQKKELRIKEEELKFYDITIKFLDDYEYWLSEIKGKSLNTVGAYLRELRTIFNENGINSDFYSFGKKKYQIPKVTKPKSALLPEEVHELWNTQPIDSTKILITPRNTKPEITLNIQEFAKDFWFIGFFLGGVNMEEVARMKWESIKDNEYTFFRTKTIRTKKGNLTPNYVFLRDILWAFIDKYNAGKRLKSGYVFPIINDVMTLKERKNRVDFYCKNVREGIRELCQQNPKLNGWSDSITYSIVRHSYATYEKLKNNLSIESIANSLGHSPKSNQTQTYLATAYREEKRNTSNLMNDQFKFMN